MSDQGALVEEISSDSSLDDPLQLKRRAEALDILEVVLLNTASGTAEAGLITQAKDLYERLEAINEKLYRDIRSDVMRGSWPSQMLSLAAGRPDTTVSKSESYDYLDDLVSGVLKFDQPGDESVVRSEEMVFYQPTPARHIFDLIDQVPITSQDVLVDLGSGLGHVSMLVSMCTGARSVGIELEPAYVASARLSALALNLSSVKFIEQDARNADLSRGTVFYLYTPFRGAILSDVLESIRREAETRLVNVCTFGDCALTIAQEPWLEANGSVEANRVSVFRSIA